MVAFKSSVLYPIVLLSVTGLSGAVNCPATDDVGGTLTNGFPTEDGFVACEYTKAGHCEYFGANGTFDSGASACPNSIPPQDVDSGTTTSSTIITTSIPPAATTSTSSTLPPAVTTSSSTSTTILATTSSITTSTSTSITTTSTSTTSTSIISTSTTTSVELVTSSSSTSASGLVTVFSTATASPTSNATPGGGLGVPGSSATLARPQNAVLSLSVVTAVLLGMTLTFL